MNGQLIPYNSNYFNNIVHCRQHSKIGRFAVITLGFLVLMFLLLAYKSNPLRKVDWLKAGTKPLKVWFPIMWPSVHSNILEADTSAMPWNCFRLPRLVSQPDATSHYYWFNLEGVWYPYYAFIMMREKWMRGVIVDSTAVYPIFTLQP